MLFMTGQITADQNRSYDNALGYLRNKSKVNPENSRLKHLIKELETREKVVM